MPAVLPGSTPPPTPSGDRPGVCTPWAGLGDLTCLDYEVDPVVAEDVLQFASDVLYDLTGRVWPGECLDVVRPCAARRRSSSLGWWPIGEGRGDLGACSCNRSQRCGCSSLSEVRLADHVVEIVQVLVDGEVVPPVEYALDDHRYLVGLQRADGSDRVWPCCQRLDLPTTEAGTWQVTMVQGGLPPRGGAMAAASLACELLKAVTGDAKGCRLPKRVTQVTRQNVSVAVLDPLTLFADGLTGLPEVDLWVASVMKGRERRRGRLIVPGQRGGVTRRT